MKRTGHRNLLMAAISLTAAILLLIIVPALATNDDYGITSGNKDHGVQTAVATIAATARAADRRAGDCCASHCCASH